MKFRLIALLALPLAFSAAAAQRIVSIGGDVTQIIYALDAQQELVARDSTSLHPAVATKLPDVGYMRMLNAEGILALKPTLVIASELAKPALALQQVEQNGVKVVDVTGKNDISAINEKIQTIAAALHREEQGTLLQKRVRSQLAKVPAQQLPVKVLFILAHQGMGAMAAGSGTSADGAIRAAGLQNAMASIQRYQPLSQEGVDCQRTAADRRYRRRYPYPWRRGKSVEAARYRADAGREKPTAAGCRRYGPARLWH